MRVFHHVLLKCGHENAEMQKKKQFDGVTLQHTISLLVKIIIKPVIKEGKKKGIGSVNR